MSPTRAHFSLYTKSNKAPYLKGFEANVFHRERANFIICKCLYKQFSLVCFVVELTHLTLATSASVAKTSSTSEMSRVDEKSFLSDYVAS